MKTRNKISYIWLALILIFLISGCGKKEADKYGQAIQNRSVTKIEAILKTPADFDGKTVTVQGKIIRECPTGCWFEVKENSAIIYVDLNPSAFAIPQKVAKTVTVEGKVSVRNNQPMLIGTGVEIK
ncbi:MAG: hypothetical protein JXB29_04400 [Sedimentisphaerales bacterium]|nr:hypothetical protein [Sedimentisphaerales bacterium]